MTYTDLNARINIVNEDYTNYILSKLPSWYDLNEGMLNRYFIDAVGKELTLYYTYLKNVQNNFWVDTAYGISLDRIGSLVQCSRKVGEDDDSYRIRIKNSLTLLVGGGSKKAIQQSLSNLLSIPEEDIEIYDKTPIPTFIAYINIKNLLGKTFNSEGIDTTIKETKAAGVNYEWSFLMEQPQDSFQLSETGLDLQIGYVNVGQFDLDNWDECYFGENYNNGRYSLDEYNECIYG